MIYPHSFHSSLPILTSFYSLAVLSNILLFYYIHQHEFTILGNSCLWRKTLPITLLFIPQISEKYSNKQQAYFQQIGLKS